MIKKALAAVAVAFAIVASFGGTAEAKSVHPHPHKPPVHRYVYYGPVVQHPAWDWNNRHEVVVYNPCTHSLMVML